MRTRALGILVVFTACAFACTSSTDLRGPNETGGIAGPILSNSLTPSSESPAKATNGRDQLSVQVPAPGGVVSALGSIWVQSKPQGSVWRLARDGEVLAKISHVSRNSGDGIGQQTIVAGFGAVWTLVNGTVVKIDPTTNRPVARIPVAPYSAFLAVGMGKIWVACCAPAQPSINGRPRLLAIDPGTNAIRSETHLPTSPSGLAAGAGFVWWINGSEASSISRIDPSTGRDLYLQTPSIRAMFVITASRHTWLVDANGGISLMPFKTRGPKRPTKVAPQTLGVTAGLGSVWINGGDLIGLDPATGDVTAYVPVASDQSPQVLAGIAVLGSRVWLVDVAGQRVVGIRV